MNHAPASAGLINCNQHVTSERGLTLDDSLISRDSAIRPTANKLLIEDCKLPLDPDEMSITGDKMMDDLCVLPWLIGPNKQLFLSSDLSAHNQQVGHSRRDGIYIL